MNYHKLMKQVQKMQADMARVHEELGRETVEAAAGGGAVQVTVNGHLELVSVRIQPEAVDPDDVEMLQDLILAAVNEGLRAARKTAEQKMAAVTGGITLPGVGGLI